MTLKYNVAKTLGSKAALLIAALYEEKLSIFRLTDVQRILAIKKPSATNFVRKLVNRGIASRLKPGLFILVPFELGKEREYLGDPLIVAREIACGKGYYFSHGSAMQIHQMLTQPQLLVYASVLKPRRPVRVLGAEFQFIHTPRKYFFGVADHWATKETQVKVSDLEKTVIDGLRQPEYCGGLTEVAKGLWMRHQDMNPARLIEYAKKTGVGAVVRRLGYLMELYKIGAAQDLEALQNTLTETYMRLDPRLLAEGKFLRRWRLQLNVSPEELLAVVRT
ncbi:MAG TPA: type IV toxin-antitoxin system AbiEi family antitoxin [Candidatus Omnitrophota bacterium]|nr:type IV toxin-antitoxin system AbiEi family antitoxin [Candidatus Omnitrophota bacterium]